MAAWHPLQPAHNRESKEEKGDLPVMSVQLKAANVRLFPPNAANSDTSRKSIIQGMG